MFQKRMPESLGTLAGAKSPTINFVRNVPVRTFLNTDLGETPLKWQLQRGFSFETEIGGRKGITARAVRGSCDGHGGQKRLPHTGFRRHVCWSTEE